MLPNIGDAEACQAIPLARRTAATIDEAEDAAEKRYGWQEQDQNGVAKGDAALRSRRGCALVAQGAALCGGAKDHCQGGKSWQNRRSKEPFRAQKWPNLAPTSHDFASQLEPRIYFISNDLPSHDRVLFSAILTLPAGTAQI
jgi:hypothetical protein